MRAVGRYGGRAVRTTLIVAGFITALPPYRLTAVQVPAPGDLSGTVRDESGRPLPLTLLTASAESSYTFYSDTSGAFHLYRMNRGVYAVTASKPGYATSAYDVLVFPGERPDVDIRLGSGSGATAASRRFDASGFEERRQQHLTSDGGGWYLVASEIAQLHVARTTQLLEGVPGIELKRDTQGVVSAWGANGTCLIPIFIDGVEARGIYRPRIESSGASYRTVMEGPGLDAFVRPSDIKAMEYQEIVSWLPPIYRSPSTVACGPIAIWTRQS